MALGTSVPDATDKPANNQTPTARAAARNLLAARMTVSRLQIYWMLDMVL